MAQTKNQAPSYDPIAKPMAEVNWDNHQANLAKRKAARDANKHVARECLNAENAATYEARKEQFKFHVSAVFQRPDSRGRLQDITEKRTVQAKSRDEAWAKFCDAIGAWPSPHNCDRVIEQVKGRDTGVVHGPELELASA